MLKDDFDEWLARIFCDALNISPTPYIRQLNRSSSQTNQESARKRGTMGDLEWLEALLTRVCNEASLKIPATAPTSITTVTRTRRRKPRSSTCGSATDRSKTTKSARTMATIRSSGIPAVLPGLITVSGFMPFDAAIQTANANAQHAMNPPQPSAGAGQQKQIGSGGNQEEQEPSSAATTIKLLLESPNQRSLKKKALTPAY